MPDEYRACSDSSVREIIADTGQLVPQCSQPPQRYRGRHRSVPLLIRRVERERIRHVGSGPARATKADRIFAGCSVVPDPLDHRLYRVHLLRTLQPIPFRGIRYGGRLGNKERTSVQAASVRYLGPSASYVGLVAACSRACAADCDPKVRATRSHVSG
jgi:hypothetical protein